MAAVLCALSVCEWLFKVEWDVLLSNEAFCCKHGLIKRNAWIWNHKFIPGEGKTKTMYDVVCGKVWPFMRPYVSHTTEILGPVSRTKKPLHSPLIVS